MMMIERQMERLAADIERAGAEFPVDGVEIDGRLMGRAERGARPTAISVVDHLNGGRLEQGDDPIDRALELIVERLLAGRGPACAAAPALAVA